MPRRRNRAPLADGDNRQAEIPVRRISAALLLFSSWLILRQSWAKSPSIDGSRGTKSSNPLHSVKPAGCSAPGLRRCVNSWKRRAVAGVPPLAGQFQSLCSSSSALASFRPAASKLSVNQLYISASGVRALVSCDRSQRRLLKT